MVVEGWAPQTKILEHPSIGGFVSHCGWSSVMESMKLGVPIIAVPMQLDQPINARLVAEVGVGVEVKRDANGKLERGKVAKVIREVVEEKAGEGVRRKAKELKEKIREKGEEEIDGVVQELVQLCRRKNRH
jgi:UDP:flavonoid glycosyltransferase YjiC (YdhE family)